MTSKLGFSVGSVAIAAALALLGAAAPNEKLGRGKYLTEQVGLCIDCHTPHTEKGEPDKSQWLKGAPIGFKPIHPMPWAEYAPELAGLRAWKDDHIVTLLSTAKRPDGTAPRPPMPPYRMTKEDAAAVAAYLRSLK